jgi:tRNA(His) guanylyltransferase
MFEATEARMEAFEHFGGQRLAPEMFSVLSLRAVGLDKLVDDKQMGLSGPYDSRLGKVLLKAAAYLLREQTEVIYAFVAPPELNLLLDVDSFRERRDPRALVTRFAGLASAKGSLLVGFPISFDCRLFCFPGEEQATDYFSWRQDARLVGTLDHYCRWVLVDNGADPAGAERILDGLGLEEKQEVLANNEVGLDQIPAWQRGGSGIFWGDDANGKSQLVIDTELPTGDDYRDFVTRFLS